MTDEELARSMTPPVAPPLELDRAALERVLARAAELHAGGVDAPDGISEQQLLEIGREVGLPAGLLRQALAEERTRVAVPEERGLVADLFGAARASASRIVPGAPAKVLASLDHWMQRREVLRPRRRFGDRLTWEARRDLAGSLQVAFGIGGRSYGLTRAAEVSATVAAADGERVVVRLDADLAPVRGRSVSWSIVTLGAGVASSTALLALAASFWDGSMLLAGGVAGTWSALGAAGAWAIARAHQRRVARAQLSLEQILDRLEHGELGEQPVNPLVGLLSSISR